MEYRRLNAALPAFGKMDPRWLRFGEHHASENEFLRVLG
jgi:hypothetical protein